MKGLFYEQQSPEERKVYVDLLRSIGSLSYLFADTESPYLIYRAMENIFCKAFNAENLSRSDVSVDASKNRLGIGLKTFLQGNGKTFQKVAEFNRDGDMLRKLGDNPKDLILQVALMRNKRIEFTMNSCKLDVVIYHMVTRSPNLMSIFEEVMDPIDIPKIKITQVSKSSIHFEDGKHEYSFNLSKSTLLKRFNTNADLALEAFEVTFNEDPYQSLIRFAQESEQAYIKFVSNSVVDHIVLPLYSTRTGLVPERSGLNQWNAKGRIRDPDEVYIAIPSWIHRTKPEFFTYNTEDFKTEPFEVELPSHEKLTMRVAQEGGKALMSNPNLALGKWILRDVLAIPPKTLVTMDMLDLIGIDSVQLSKLKDGTYRLDFLEKGSFAEFENEIRIEE